MSKTNNQDTAFLPEGYETPKSQSNYIKFEDGDNKFRILSAPVIGWLDWKDKKPVRFRNNEKPEKSIDPTKPVKHFWAMVALDRKDDRIKILEITQKSVLNSITELIKSSDWGSPLNYDLNVKKSGKDMATEYSVIPSPPKPIDVLTKNALESTKVNLEALFSNGDPFAS